MSENKVDFWTHYRDNFPRRYIDTGIFDGFVMALAYKEIPTRVLDIGGGVTGTESLRSLNVSAYLLDPYVKETPAWMTRCDWDTDLKFDLIVARGVLAYLSEEELKKIPEMLSPRGVFVANSFAEMPENKNRCFETLAGKSGVEKIRISPDNTILHELDFPQEQRKIQHHFHFYSSASLKALFPKADFVRYGKNSVLIVVRK